MQHKDLAGGRWKQLRLVEQLANVGSEVERTIKWREKGNQDYSHQAFIRALELLDLTIDNALEFAKLKELTRLRELLVDYFMFNNDFKSSDTLWRNYFYSFNYAARI